MNVSCTGRSRAPRLRLLICLLILCGDGPVGSLEASDFSIVRIEEDWELVVTTPETTSNSPQVTCAMSATGTDESDYMSFEMNLQSQPSYAIGGLHLHAWNGDYLRGSAHAQSGVPVQDSDELITWTQSMTVSNGTLTYEITNGSSTTWGSFGDGELKLTVSTARTDLHSYQVEGSLSGSGVGFGANRVSALRLKKVRFITNGGQVYDATINHNVLAQGGS